GAEGGAGTVFRAGGAGAPGGARGGGAPVGPAARPVPPPPRGGPPVSARLGPAAPRLAALLLGAACIAWAATPLRHDGPAETALVVAIIAVTAGALRLARSDVPEPGGPDLAPAPIPARLVCPGLLRLLPWEEIALAAVLWLEVQHAARPWHTAALGAALVGYLLATHIAESGAAPGRLLRRQAKVLLAGACLL